MSGGKTERIFVRATLTEKGDLQSAAAACGFIRAGGYPDLSKFLLAAGYEKAERDLDFELARAREDLEAGQRENGSKPTLVFEL